jgi:ATP dependent DNA ligase C terminal region
MSQRTLALLDRRLKPLVISAMTLAAPLPKETRFDGKLALSRVHWVRPELVAEVTYLSWAEDGLLRHTVFVASRRARSGARSPREHAKRLPCVARNLPEEQGKFAFQRAGANAGATVYCANRLVHSDRAEIGLSGLFQHDLSRPADLQPLFNDAVTRLFGHPAFALALLKPALGG